MTSNGLKKYRVLIHETATYEVDVDAKTPEDAKNEARKIFDDTHEFFVCVDAVSYEAIEIKKEFT